MSSNPDRLFIELSDRELYKKVTEDSGLFRDKNNKEQFLFAMAVGVGNQLRMPFKKRDGFFLEKDLRTEDEALIDAVALSEEDNVDILADKSRVYRIAEEYAHAGIKILLDKIESIEFGSFWKQLEKELIETHQEEK